MTDVILTDIEAELAKAKAYVKAHEAWLKTNWIPLLVGFIVGGVLGHLL